MSKPSKVGVIVIVVVVACLGVLAMEAQTKIVRRAYDNFVLDNENHYLPCGKLPIEAETRRIAQEHQDVIQLMEQVNPGFVGVDIDTTSCPGKADIVVWYASHRDRVAIARIIGGKTFFGIPYRLQNR